MYVSVFLSENFLYTIKHKWSISIIQE